MPDDTPGARCPACSLDAIYTRELDRYFHADGTDNRDCWCAMSRGDAA
jgi:hypothetical protein